jgi:hypothetical protein
MIPYNFYDRFCGDRRQGEGEQLKKLMSCIFEMSDTMHYYPELLLHGLWIKNRNDDRFFGTNLSSFHYDSKVLSSYPNLVAWLGSFDPV